LLALRAMGYTEVHDLLSQEWLGPILADLDRNDELPVDRILLYPNVTKLSALISTRFRWESDRVKLAGGKLFADGTLNSRTALMLSPYANPLPGLPRGQAMATPSDIDDALSLTSSLGLQLAVHTIGDAAVRLMLDRYEHHLITAPSASLRLEHCELIDEADVPRFAKLNVVCSVQPCHLLADIPVLTRQLPHRLDRVLPLRELIDSGCRPADPDGSGLLWFGSDVPIVRANPEDSIQAAVHRRPLDAAETDAVGWSQRITQDEALAAFGDVAASPAPRRE
jgi:predicted amidohydrolase YtcJ